MNIFDRMEWVVVRLGIVGAASLIVALVSTAAGWHMASFIAFVILLGCCAGSLIMLLVSIVGYFTL